ncbi:hypothetical protein LDG_7138 [Legionella drancourtii LLAP12]|uniref:Uncharacterized protein n=1 Tax=Legionella drancourtii LLAP12 TaxID=658187 RepID=G9EPF4_9GAMM|nr:hypothetical protein LDG_7138 [Legionella drancourtii LLAP12]
MTPIFSGGGFSFIVHKDADLLNKVVMQSFGYLVMTSNHWIPVEHRRCE